MTLDDLDLSVGRGAQVGQGPSPSTAALVWSGLRGAEDSPAEPLKGRGRWLSPRVGLTVTKSFLLLNPLRLPQSRLTVAVPHLTLRRQRLFCKREGLPWGFPERRCLGSHTPPSVKGVGLDLKCRLRFV